MALNASIVWEVRTTGASTNGGGFKTGATGTDYSQQNAAQWALTGIATAGAGSTFLYASAAATMVGNVCQVISGTNMVTGFFEITSVSVGVSVTVDRAICTGISADGVINIGGAVDHPNTVSAVMTDGNIMYIKAGTYQKVGANAYVLTTAAVQSIYIGYNASRTDAPTGTNRPLLDGNSSATNCLVTGNGVQVFKFLRFASATGDNVSMGGQSSFFRCKSSSAGADGFDTTTTIGRCWVECEISSNAGYGIKGNINSLYLFYNYIHDNTLGGVTNSRTDTIGEHLYNIFESNSGSGVIGIGVNLVGGKFIGNISYNNTGASSDGVSFSGGDNKGLMIIKNNISMNNGRYGFVSSLTNQPYFIFDYNCYNGNGTALSGITAGANDITSDPLFTAPTANPPDFTLQASSPCLNTGFPDADWAVNIGLANARY